MNKAPDRIAEAVRFGVELETYIPTDCGVNVGGYHTGFPVATGFVSQAGCGRQSIAAPTFEGRQWRADRDGSIQCESETRPAEFVSPVLHGEAGLAALSAFVEFAERIGGKVNASCGCHVTVSVPSVIGSTDSKRIACFIRKLVRVADFHAWALYAQTGTARHQSIYCYRPGSSTGILTNELVIGDSCQEPRRRLAAVYACGRGMVNLHKAFPERLENSAVEFRAFAGTLNRWKVLHHVASCIGLMRKAASCRHVPRFRSVKKPTDAVDALIRLWRHLNWLDAGPSGETPFGLCGDAHTHLVKLQDTALRMAAKFEKRFPRAAL